MKFSVRNILVGLIFAFSASFIYSETFNENLSAEERIILQNGDTLIKNTPSYKKMCLSSENHAADKLVLTVKKLKPAYFAEVIKEFPVEGNEDFISRLQTMTMDISSYVGIPYYSQRNDRWYDLYSAANVKSEEKNGNFTVVNADLTMEPFGLIDMLIETEAGEDYYYYEMSNLSTLRYQDKFDCVSPKNMKSILIAFKDGDKWIMYSCGAVKAPSVFFLKERIEISFMNRIKTFCSYFFNKL